MAFTSNLFHFLVTLTKTIPVVMCMTAFVYAYCSYVLEFCRHSFPFENSFIKFTSMSLFHALFIMYLWSFVQLIATTSPEIPEHFRVSPKTREALVEARGYPDKIDMILRPMAIQLGIQTYSIDGRVRYCDVCGVVKPDRTHHCRVCKTCILKMDHHCPWINNCVSFANYKFFVLFLIYGVLSFGFILLSMCFTLVKNRQDSVWLHITLAEGFPLLLIAAVLSSVKLALLFYHIYLLLHNRTTLDAYRAPQFIYGSDRNGYDLGTVNNIYQVFGMDWNMWGIPVFTSLGNGWSFPTRSDSVFVETSLLGKDEKRRTDEKEWLISK